MCENLQVGRVESPKNLLEPMQNVHVGCHSNVDLINDNPMQQQTQVTRRCRYVDEKAKMKK